MEENVTQPDWLPEGFSTTPTQPIQQTTPDWLPEGFSTTPPIKQPTELEQIQIDLQKHKESLTPGQLESFARGVGSTAIGGWQEKILGQFGAVKREGLPPEDIGGVPEGFSMTADPRENIRLQQEQMRKKLQERQAYEERIAPVREEEIAKQRAITELGTEENPVTSYVGKGIGLLVPGGAVRKGAGIGGKMLVGGGLGAFYSLGDDGNPLVGGSIGLAIPVAGTILYKIGQEAAPLVQKAGGRMLRRTGNIANIPSIVTGAARKAVETALPVAGPMLQKTDAAIEGWLKRKGAGTFRRTLGEAYNAAGGISGAALSTISAGLGSPYFAASVPLAIKGRMVKLVLDKAANVLENPKALTEKLAGSKFAPIWREAVTGSNDVKRGILLMMAADPEFQQYVPEMKFEFLKQSSEQQTTPDWLPEGFSTTPPK